MKQLKHPLPEQLLISGKFGTVHGVKGLIKVISATDNATNILNYQPWFIKTNPGKITSNPQDWFNVTILESQILKGEIFVKLEGFTDRDLAKELTNLEIAIDRNILPELVDDYYWVDILGSKVINSEGIVFGTVSKIMETGSNDVLVVKASADAIDNQERLVPFIMNQVILSFDKQHKTLIVNWDADF